MTQNYCDNSLPSSLSCLTIVVKCQKVKLENCALVILQNCEIVTDQRCGERMF